MALRRSLAVTALGQLLGAAACGPGSFACTDDDQCNDGGAIGTCQVDGWCSFPDIECPSGQRYGRHAGGGLADECVGDDVGSTTDASDTDVDPTNVTSATSATTSVPETCGNGIVDELEACDGSVGDDTCLTLGFSGGTLGCLDSCQWDLSQCLGCGNGIREEGEVCDTFDLAGQDCTNHGFFGGALQCVGCQFDTSLCNNCGDGMLEEPEPCDGENLNGQTCALQGFFGGTITCTPGCEFDTSQCHNCGNMALDDGEVCEPLMLGGQTCLNLGYGDGLLDCSSDCRTFATMGCGALACNADPQSPLMMECPPECASCEGATCNISCLGNNSCSGITIECPAGWACNVTCDGNDACSNSTIACPAHWGCDASCNDNSACSGMTMDCSDDGTCNVVCGSGGGNLCDGVTMLCGADACGAVCSNSASVFVQCDTSCACTPC